MYHERPEVQLLRQLNVANPQLEHPLTPDNVTFGVPQVLADDPECDTQVTVTIDPNHPHYHGSVTVKYRRWDMYQLMYGLDIPADIGEFASTRQAMQSLCERHQLPLTEADVIDTPIDPDTNRGVFEAHPDSLAVTGNVMLYYWRN